jgi:hypothetical protein
VIVHRYWHGPAEPPMEPWLGQVVRKLHPGADVRDWDDQTLPLAALAWADRHQALCARHAANHRGNLVQIRVLHDHGGLWLDHDVIPLRDLRPLCGPQPWVAGLAHLPELSSAWFPAPGHPVLAGMIAAVEATARRGTRPGASPSGVSGTGLMRSVLTPDVRLERRMLPFDRAGRPIGAEPWAVHTWSTSSRHPVI